MTFSTEIEQWLEKNRGVDFASMMLKAGSDEERRRAVVQREARRRAALKLPSFVKSNDFVFPTLLSVEQCTSEFLAEYHSSLIPANSKVIDLTAGLGIDAMIIARRVREVIAIEQNSELVMTLKHNAKVMGLVNLKVEEGDSMKWLAENDCHFDVAFIDPFRRDSAGGKVVSFKDCTPDVVANCSMILSHADELIIKASPMHDVALAIDELTHRVRAVKITGTQKECKELILILSKERIDEPEMESITIMPDGNSDSFSWPYKTGDVEADYLFPREGDWVYELWPALMKGGAYKYIAKKVGANPLAPATHVYTSPELIENFPGKARKVVRILPFNKKSLKQLKNEFTHLNVAVRNFVISAPELEKRLGVKPGGEYRLLGVKDSCNANYLLLLK